jgi:hypothetical protein
MLERNDEPVASALLSLAAQQQVSFLIGRGFRPMHPAIVHLPWACSCLLFCQPLLCSVEQAGVQFASP